MPGDSKVSGIYILYRKIRYLNHRGTLLHKTPGKIRKMAGKRRRRFFLSNFRFLNVPLMSRYSRLHKFQLRKYEEKAIYSLSQNAVDGKPLPVALSKSRKRNSYRQILRAVRFLYKKRKLKRLHKKLAKAGTTPHSKIRYRKIRYLISTGKLFRLDRSKTMAYFDSRIGFMARREFLLITINSTAVFIVAALMVFVLKQVAVALAADSVDIITVMYYYDIDFLIRGADWTPDAVKIVYSAGPFTNLIVSIISLVLYIAFIDRTWFLRTFFFWVFCLSMINFLGEILVGAFLSKGFGWVLMYLYIFDTGKMLITLMAFFLLISAGLYLSRTLLFTGNIYFNYLSGKTKNQFVFSHVLLPFILGNLIIWFIKLPRITGYEILTNLSMILLLLPAIIRSRFSNDLFFEEDKKKIHPFYGWILAAILAIVLFRIVFGIGLKI